MIRRTAIAALIVGVLFGSGIVACSAGDGGGDDGAQEEAQGDVAPDGESESPRPHLPDPTDADLDRARSFYETVSLPSEPVPRALVETRALVSRCVEELGFPLDENLDREVAYQTGMFLYYAGDQVERLDEVTSACETVLDEVGAVMGTGREENERLYDIYMESQECLERHGYPTVEPPTRESFAEEPWEWYPWQALQPQNEYFIPTQEVNESEQYRPYLDSLDECPRP